MNRPRIYYGWYDEKANKYFVSLFPRGQKQAANSYDNREEAIQECIVKRTDQYGEPRIAWEN